MQQDMSRRSLLKGTLGIGAGAALSRVANVLPDATLPTTVTPEDRPLIDDHARVAIDAMIERTASFSLYDCEVHRYISRMVEQIQELALKQCDGNAEEAEAIMALTIYAIRKTEWLYQDALMSALNGLACMYAADRGWESKRDGVGNR